MTDNPANIYDIQEIKIKAPPVAERKSKKIAAVHDLLSEVKEDEKKNLIIKV
jgi:hypothetical protein